MNRGKQTPMQPRRRMFIKVLSLVTSCVGIMFLQACGSPQAPVTAPLVSIKIAPSTSLLLLASNRQLQATGTYADGTQQNITAQVTWSVSSTSSATTNFVSVAPNGMATGAALGTSVVSATLGPVVGLLQMTVNDNGFKAGTFAIVAATANNTVVDAAYVPLSKFIDSSGIYKVQVIDVDADQFSTTLPVQTALLASIPMPSGFVPNATAADQNTQKVAVISYSSPTVVVIDASNDPNDLNSNTIVGTFKSPVTQTTSFNGVTCMICAIEVNPANDQLILSTAQGYYTMDLTAGTFTALSVTPTLDPAPSFTLNPVFIDQNAQPKPKPAPYFLSPTFGTSAGSQLQSVDLNSNTVTSDSTLGLTSPGAAVIDLFTNQGAVIDVGANAQSFLDLSVPSSPAPTLVQNLGVCSSGPQLFDMGALGVGVGVNQSQVSPTFFLAQSSGSCVGFEVWPNAQSVGPIQPSTVAFGYGAMPVTPDGNAFVTKSDRNAIATFTSVVDRKNYGVLIDATQKWMAKVNFATVISSGNGFNGATLPVGQHVAEATVLNAGVGGASIVYLPTNGIVALSALSINFGNQTVGTASVPSSIIVTNTATATSLNISQISVQGPNAGDFAQTNDCPATVAPKGTCTITVIFTPAAAGARTATLSIADDGGNSPQTVALSGTGD